MAEATLSQPDTDLTTSKVSSRDEGQTKHLSFSPTGSTVHYGATEVITEAQPLVTQDMVVVKEDSKPRDMVEMKPRPLTVKSVLKSLLFSKWITAALVLLLVSNVLFLVAFVTNGWGTLTVEAGSGQLSTPTPPSGNASTPAWLRPLTPHGGTPAQTTVYWKFGLWQCCRNTDGVCIGTRWPVFYSATRSLSVLALFFNCLSFAWMLGHSLEQLLDIDICTMTTLAMICFSTSIFSLSAVAIFGTWWPIEFKNEFHGTHPELSFSFWIACSTAPLNFLAGVLVILDLNTSYILLEQKLPVKHYQEDGSTLDEQDMVVAEIAASSHVRINMWDRPQPQPQPKQVPKEVESWFTQQQETEFATSSQ